MLHRAIHMLAQGRAGGCERGRPCVGCCRRIRKGWMGCFLKSNVYIAEAERLALGLEPEGGSIERTTLTPTFVYVLLSGASPT